MGGRLRLGGLVGCRGVGRGVEGDGEHRICFWGEGEGWFLAIKAA